LSDVTLPQLGETVTEGTITKWLVKVGDTVAIDQPIFEVSTDKVDSEVPSPVSGVVTEILVPEGETVDVGTVLARIEAASAASPTAPAAPSAPTPPPAPPTAPAAPSAPTPPPAPPTAPAAPSAPTPPPAPVGDVATTAAEAASTNGAVAVGERRGDLEGLLLSPVVRKLILENGLDPRAIRGTGVGGRITRADVLRALDERAKAGGDSTPPPAPPTAPAAPSAPTPPPVAQGVPSAAGTGPSAPTWTAPVAPGSELETAPRSQVAVPEVELGERDYVVPFTNIRRRTAEHMVRSKATSAHTLMSIEVDFEGVEQVRRRLREAFKQEEGFSLTYLPFVVRAAVEAIRAYPNINASVLGDALVVHRDINIAIAVDLNLEGLIAPVIHQADAIRLRGIARAIHDLATRARTRKLNADDIAGGTFTITNPGPFGTFMTGAIINQPQVAILATDGITRRPVVVTDQRGVESIAIHSVGLLTVNFDHRAIDGAYAAAFLAKAKQVIEETDWGQEL